MKLGDSYSDTMLNLDALLTHWYFALPASPHHTVNWIILSSRLVMLSRLAYKQITIPNVFYSPFFSPFPDYTDEN